MVYCKSKGYQSGFAYFHSKVGSKYAKKQIMPYLVSDVSCSGDESSLEKCSFNNASALNRNCTEGHDAGVICFKEGSKFNKFVINLYLHFYTENMNM
jgi:hypothetical protein